MRLSVMTYGDGVSDVDINELIFHHQNHGKSGYLNIGQTAWTIWSIYFESMMNRKLNILRKNQKETQQMVLPG